MTKGAVGVSATLRVFVTACAVGRRWRLLAWFLIILGATLIVSGGCAHITPETGDLAEAERLNREGLALYSSGKYADAEPLLRRALAIRELALGPEHPDLALSLNSLALLFHARGEYAKAEPLYRGSLAIREKAFGADHPAMATALYNLGELYHAQGRYAEAEPFYRRSLEIREKVFGPEHPEVARSLGGLAGFYHDSGNYAQAEPLYRRSLAIREKTLGQEHPAVAQTLNNLGQLYRAQGQYAKAEPLFSRALSIWETTLGSAHPTVAKSLTNMAFLQAVQQKTAEARQYYDRARRVLLAATRANVDLDDEALRSLVKGGEGSLRNYLDLLAGIGREPGLDPNGPAPDRAAFLMAEQTRSGVVDWALAKAAARLTIADPQTATLLREAQDLRTRRQALRRELDQELVRHGPWRDTTRLASLRQTVQEMDRKLAEVTSRLRQALPRYAELAAPDPIEVTGLQQLLRSDEALLSLFTLKDRVLVWVVRAGSPLVYRDLPIKQSDIVTMVQQVRKSLDQSGSPDLAMGQLVPFDVASAHRLYMLLVAPVQSHLQGVRHLLVVSDEVLLPVPFGVLVTSADGEAYQRLKDLAEKKLPPTPADLVAYGELPWLAKEYAITVLPSATSLRLLRQLATLPGTPSEPFLGVGDPEFAGGGHQRGGAMIAARGAAVPIDELRRMNRLPGTRRELQAVATALKADPAKALYLGPQANETMVHSLNRTGRLAEARVVSFATHGLLAGELKGLTQPALALTPPKTPTEEDDGLLTLEEIFNLKLPKTEWVILSACNTAAGDGSGEGLAGLARAFFFAGAKALLVSHWGVDDRATETLMREIFQGYAKDPTLSRVEALRQGMLALMKSAQGPTAYFAHPFAWAAFSVVGEGGR